MRILLEQILIKEFTVEDNISFETIKKKYDNGELKMNDGKLEELNMSNIDENTSFINLLNLKNEKEVPSNDIVNNKHENVIRLVECSDLDVIYGYLFYDSSKVTPSKIQENINEIKNSYSGDNWSIEDVIEIIKNKYDWFINYYEETKNTFIEI